MDMEPPGPCRWSDEVIAVRMWKEILKGKGLSLHTPYVFRNDYGKVQRNEAICDYWWRKVYVQKGWPIAPVLIDSANESNSEPSDDDDDDDFYAEQYKNNTNNKIEEATPKQNRHIRFRYESDDDESADSNNMSTETTTITLSTSSVSSNQSHPPVCRPNRHIRFRYESDDDDDDEESVKKKMKTSNNHSS